MGAVDAPRARWSSRSIFIVACVGSAIGLGNVWRFPYLNYKYGGGAFLLPYFIFLMVTGLPLMQAELALGRLRQSGDIEAFGSIHRRARGVGVISVIGGFGVVVYYSVIIAWACVYFVGSFKPDLPWATADCGSAGDPNYETCIADPDQALPISAANSYYYDTVMRYNPRNVEKGTATIITGPVFAGLLFAWIFCYFSIWKGVASVGQAVKLTVFVPWILLGIMLVYTATLDGSGDGVKAYIGIWDMSILKQGQVWADAAGQIFFTLGATLGIMTAYGSYAPKSTNMFVNNNLIGYINCFTSLFAGFVIFSILGHMAWKQNQILGNTPTLRGNMCAAYTLVDGSEYKEECASYDCGLCSGDLWDGETCCGYTTTDTVASAGLGLAFVVYPAVMTLLPSAAGNIFSLAWFACLFLLGIDSMFAMVEGVATVITDTDRYKHLKKEIVAAVTCAIGFLVSIAYATDIGLALLDVADHYIINYALFLTGAAEAYVVSWVWGWRETADLCGKTCAMFLTGGYTLACIFGIVIGGSIHYEVDTGVNVGIGVGIGAAIFLLGIIAGYVTRTNKGDGFMAWMRIWFFAGSRNLSSTFKPNAKPWELKMFAIFYDFPIKYICPATLGALVVTTAVSDAQYETGYGDYPAWMQAVFGIILLGTMVGSLVFFALCPGFWDKLSEPAQAIKDANDAKAQAQRVEDGGSSGMEDEYDDWGRKVVVKNETGL